MSSKRAKKVNKEIRNVVCYLRVSTKEQVVEGNSLVVQNNICKEYAKDNGLNIVKVFTEEGESAKTADRTKLKEMMLFCKAHFREIDGLLIYKVDRLSRDVTDYLTLKGSLHALGIKVISISEKFEDTPAGRFTETVLAGQAQFDNDIRTERSVNGMRTAIMEGRYVWRAPKGYKNGKVNGKSNIVIDEVNAKYIKRIFELVSGGFSNLEELRYLMKNEGFNVSRSELHRIVRRKLYYGLIENLDVESMGVFEPIISEDLFNRAQDVLDGKDKKSERKYASLNTDFPLRKFIFNEKKEKVTGGWSKGNGGRYGYYRFNGKGSKSVKKEVFENNFKEYLNTFSLNYQFAEMLEIALRANWEARNGGIGKDRGIILRKIAELENERKEIVKKNLKGVIPDDLVRSCLDDNESAIKDLRMKIFEMEEVQNYDDEIVSQSFKILSNLGNEWEEIEDVERKTSLQWFLFPQGVYYEDNKFRTNELSRLINKKETPELQESRNG